MPIRRAATAKACTVKGEKLARVNMQDYLDPDIQDKLRLSTRATVSRILHIFTQHWL